MVDKATGSMLTGTFVNSEQVCLEDFSLPCHRPKQTLPKLKACNFHAKCHHNMIVSHDISQAFGMQLNVKDGCIVCDAVSIPMCEFLNGTPQAVPIEHLSQDHLDCNKCNDKDEFSFDDNFDAEILDGLCEAGNMHEVVD